MKALKICVVLLVMTLAGCSWLPPLSSRVVLSNGEAGYKISCSQFGGGHASCFTKAGNVCPSGYVVTRELTWDIFIKCK